MRIPDSVPNVTAQELVDRQRVQEKLMEQFWSVWSQDYIRNLPPLRVSGPEKKVGVGSVVLKQEDGCPRLQWSRALVTKVFPRFPRLVSRVSDTTGSEAIPPYI